MKKCLIKLKNPKFNPNYKGFCSMICQSIDIGLEHYTNYKNFDIVVENEQINTIFDSKNTNGVFYDGDSWYLSKFFTNTLSATTTNAHQIINTDHLKLKNLIFQNTLFLKNEFKVFFERKIKKYQIDENTLGVQIRGTDKKTELSPIKIENCFLQIDDCLKKFDIKKIFISTDDKKYLYPLLYRYGDLIEYDSDISISHDSSPLHLDPNKDRKIINQEVISQVYLLSRCKYFLYSFSNVSHLAGIWGINNHVFRNNLNTNFTERIHHEK